MADTEAPQLDGLAPEPDVAPEPTTAKRKRTRTPKADTAPRRPGRPSNDDKLRERILDLYMGLGMAAMVASPADGEAVVAEAEACTDAAMLMAKRYPSFRKYLEKADEGAAWLTFAMAHGRLVARILANHSVIPPEVGQAIAGTGAGAAAGVDMAQLASDLFPGVQFSDEQLQTAMKMATANGQAHGG